MNTKKSEDSGIRQSTRTRSHPSTKKPGRNEQRVEEAREESNWQSDIAPDPGHHLLLQHQRRHGNRATQRLAKRVQTKLEVGRPNDKYEREADRVATAVLQTSNQESDERSIENSRTSQSQRLCVKCERRARQGKPLNCTNCEQTLQRTASSGEISLMESSTARTIESSHETGRPLSESARSFFEPRFGRTLSRVRIHDGGRAAELNRSLDARAFTHGRDVYFGAGNYNPDTESGRRLIAHELTHVVQQGRTSRNLVQRQTTPADQGEADPSAVREEPLTGPLTDREWEQLELWQSLGMVGSDPLTENPDHNALVVAEAIFCGRFIASDQFYDSAEDPLLCVIPMVTRADPRVQQLVQHVTARGPIINWTQVVPNQRMLHVMELLVNTYHFPENGAAGLVGNLWSESGVLPNRIEGSRPRTPMTAQNFAGQSTEFTAEQVMNRNRAARQGPRRPGIGLAQWTSANRRTGLFQHTFQGRQQGAAILFNMDAQIDYLVTELQSNYAHVYNILMGPGVSLNDASDEVVYRFEVPGAVLDAHGNLLPRSDPAVQAVFTERRANSQRALQVFRAAQP